MPRPRVEELGRGRLLLDLGFRDQEGLVAAYLIPQEDGWTLVETGPTSCQQRLVDAVAAGGVEPGQIHRILVTHIHLDHAGGLGVAAESFPRARLFAHSRGVPHLLDPSRLETSARRAWGAASAKLWGPIRPVPPDRLEGLAGGEEFTIKGGVLRVINTPGHAQHHLAFFDEPLSALMTGDAAGVKLSGSLSARPALPPPDLDIDLLIESVSRMAELAPARLLYSHFGPSPDSSAQLAAYTHSVKRWAEYALAVARSQPSVSAIAASLREADAERNPSAGVNAAAREDYLSGYEMAAQGLLRYFRTHGLIPTEGAA